MSNHEADRAQRDLAIAREVLGCVNQLTLGEILRAIRRAHDSLGGGPVVGGDELPSDPAVAAQAAEPPSVECTLPAHTQRGYCDAEAWFKGKGEGYSEAIEEFADDVARAVQAEQQRAAGIMDAICREETKRAAGDIERATYAAAWQAMHAYIAQVSLGGVQTGGAEAERSRRSAHENIPNPEGSIGDLAQAAEPPSDSEAADLYHDSAVYWRKRYEAEREEVREMIVQGVIAGLNESREQPNGFRAVAEAIADRLLAEARKP